MVTDVDPPHDFREDCGCDLCDATRAELNDRADAARLEAVDHQDAALCEVALPWQRTWTRADRVAEASP